MLARLVPLLGIIVILGIAFLFSNNRRAVSPRIVGWGLGLQFLIALFVLRTRAGYWTLDGASRGAVWLLNFAFAGSKFVFGPLGDPQGHLGSFRRWCALLRLIRDTAGNLYRATAFGGSGAGGTIFELSPSKGGSAYIVIYSFAGSGAAPMGNVVAAPALSPA